MRHTCSKHGHYLQVKEWKCVCGQFILLQIICDDDENLILLRRRLHLQEELGQRAETSPQQLISSHIVTGINRGNVTSDNLGLHHPTIKRDSGSICEAKILQSCVIFSMFGEIRVKKRASGSGCSGCTSGGDRRQSRKAEIVPLVLEQAQFPSPRVRRAAA